MTALRAGLLAIQERCDWTDLRSSICMCCEFAVASRYLLEEVRFMDAAVEQLVIELCETHLPFPGL